MNVAKLLLVILALFVFSLITVVMLNDPSLLPCAWIASFWKRRSHANLAAGGPAPR